MARLHPKAEVLVSRDCRHPYATRARVTGVHPKAKVLVSRHCRHPYGTRARVTGVHTKISARAGVCQGNGSRCVVSGRLCAKIGWHVGWWHYAPCYSIGQMYVIFYWVCKFVMMNHL